MLLDLLVTVNQAETRLQNVRASNFMDAPGTNRRQFVPAGPRGDGRCRHRLAAPRGKDDFWIGAANLLWGHDASGRGPLRPQSGKDVIAPGALDQVTYPRDAGNERVVTFLEINVGTGNDF